MCQECGAKTRVYDSRGDKHSIWRRRECDQGHRFTTIESVTECDDYEYKAIREISRGG